MVAPTRGKANSYQEALDEMRGLADDAILVGDGAILQGMRLLHRHAGVVAKLSGAVGFAALLEQPDTFQGQLVGTIVSGGNLTADQMAEWLTP